MIGTFGLVTLIGAHCPVVGAALSSPSFVTMTAAITPTTTTHATTATASWAGPRGRLIAGNDSETD